MISEKDYPNLHKIKTLYFFILFLSILVQFLLIENYKNFYGLFFVFLSNILIIYYCFSKKNVREFPLSSFSLIFVNIYSNSGALIFKSFTLSSIDETLYNSNFTFGYLFFFNFFLILLHYIYSKSHILISLKKTFQKLFLFLKFNDYEKKEYLFFIGYLSIFFGAFSVTFFSDYIWKSSLDGPNIIGDILNGLKVLYICPFIILFTFKIYNFSLNKKDIIKILISFVLVLYLSLGLNSRSVFFDIIFSGLIIYCYFIYTNLINIKVLKVNKLFFLTIFLILLSNYVDFFSNSYLEVRKFRNNTNPIQNIKNHINFFNNNKEILLNQNMTNQNQQIFAENYYNIDFLNRINVIKATDNIIYAKQFLTKSEIEDIKNFEYNKVISILPNPVIKIFSASFNKSLYFDTITSTVYKKVDRSYVGGKSNGIVFSILYLYADFWYFLIFVVLIFITFSLLDSFKNNEKHLIILFVFFYLTSGGLINLISSGSVADMIGSLVRGIPQSLILYLLICFLYKKVFFVR